MFRGKRYKEAKKTIEITKFYQIDNAVEIIKKISKVKFDETVDLAIKLGVDPKHAEQMVRGTVLFPNGLGKKVRILVFAKGEKAKEAINAGADFVGAEELIDKINNGWLEFDKILSTPDLMPLVSKIAKILGPKGLMPNPKMGTVTFELDKSIQEYKKGKIEFKVEKNGIIHSSIGKLSFSIIWLKQNIVALFKRLIKLKPASSKGIYIQSVSISSTMGPGLKLDLTEIRSLLK